MANVSELNLHGVDCPRHAGAEDVVCSCGVENPETGKSIDWVCSDCGCSGWGYHVCLKLITSREVP